MFEQSGVPPAELSEDDLRRELRQLHQTRHDAFLYGSDDALAAHTRRTAELEAEFVRRYPRRLIDPDRLRIGARERADQGREQPVDPR